MASSYPFGLVTGGTAASARARRWRSPKPASRSSPPVSRRTRLRRRPPVLFLLCDAARFVTGAVLPVDGGYLAA